MINYQTIILTFISPVIFDVVDNNTATDTVTSVFWKLVMFSVNVSSDWTLSTGGF